MKFVLNRDLVVPSLTGHSIGFIAGVPTHVPRAMHAEVMAVGARESTEEDETPEPAEETKEAYVPENPEERAEVIGAVLGGLLATNDRSTFTATGVPKVKVVQDAVGFPVTSAEIADLWAALIVEKE